MTNIWVVLADGERARIFEAETPRALREIEDLWHPEGRSHEGDLVQDSPGQAYDSRVQGRRHAMSTHNSPKQQEAIYFARDIAQRLEEARNTGRFQALVLAAPPHFLGLLREAMPKTLHKVVVLELNKDLAHIQRLDELIKHLPEKFPVLEQ